MRGRPLPSLAVIVIVVFLPRQPHDRGRPHEQPGVGACRRSSPWRRSRPIPSTAVSDVVVIRSEEYTVDAPQFEAYVTRFVGDGEITALGLARTYLDDGSAALVSQDRHATIIPVALVDDDETEALVEKVEAVDDEAAFAVSVTGDETLDHDFNLLSQEDLENGELKFGLPAALIILLLVFGAVVAGLVPLLMAIVSIVVALGLTRAPRAAVRALGLRRQHAHGHGPRARDRLLAVRRLPLPRGARTGKAELAAIEASGATASRAVLFSGSVFVVAMFGMLLVPNSIMRSLAVGAILVGIVSVAAALTLLPAVLGLLGDKVDALRIPLVGRALARAVEPRGPLLGRDRPPSAAPSGVQPALSAGRARSHSRCPCSG